jgi:hypothetical protein
MKERKQSNDGHIRRKRGDTRIETIEKEYGVNFGVRSDTKLSTFLKDSGIPSLSKALKKLNNKK